MNMSRRTIIFEEVKKLGLDPNKPHDLKKLEQLKRQGGVKHTQTTSNVVDEDDHDLDDRENVGDDVESVDVIDVIDVQDLDVIVDTVPQPEEPKPTKKRLFVKKVTHSE